MKRIILVMALMLALPCITQELVIAQSIENVGIESVRAAIVRVQVNGSVGSGTVFLEKENSYCILTNSHVAGKNGSQVLVEMWDHGYLREPVAGKVVYSVRKNNYYRDIAVIEVQKADLDGYVPKVVLIAPAAYKPDYSQIYSFGCGAGSWITSWEGHAFSHESNSGDVINFFPQPAGGRSGSGIFSPDGKYIVALIAWRSPSGQHSLDGKNENLNYHGIAMTKDEIRSAFKGVEVSNYLEVTPYPLILPQLKELNADPVSGPLSQFIYQEEVPDCRTSADHGADDVLQGRTLKYQELPEYIPEYNIEDLESQLLRRRQSPRLLPQTPPEPQDDGPRSFELPEDPQIQPEQRPILPKLKKILPDPEPEPEPQQFELEKSAPKAAPKDEPKAEPEKELKDAPKEAPSESYWQEDLITVVLWAAAITGFFCWFKLPLMALITTVAVWGGADTVRKKLEKKDSK